MNITYESENYEFKSCWAIYDFFLSKQFLKHFWSNIKKFKIRQWEKYFKYRYFYPHQYGKASHTTLNTNAGKSKKNSGFTELILISLIQGALLDIFL